MLVSHRITVDGRGCGNVDNMPNAVLVQVAAASAVHSPSEVPTARLGDCSYTAGLAPPIGKVPVVVKA